MSNDIEGNTALARTEEPVELTEAGKQEIEQIRQTGALAVARTKEIGLIQRQLAGMTWGSGSQAVKGSDLSGATRYAIAQICDLTGANPGLHLFILGGRPYLNADYWGERIAGEPRFIRYEQVNLSESHIEELRKIADQADADGDPEEARNLRRQARELAARRSHWSPPVWATVVIETRIFRFTEIAPLSAIRAGQADPAAWTEMVAECNWAGGKPKQQKKGQTGSYEYDPDPVGNAEPSKTARSRSLRRAAIRAFKTTLQPVEAQLSKLEQAIEAEFEVIESEQRDERAALPPAGQTQAVIGNGEPEARSAAGAQDLPTQTTPAAAPSLDAVEARRKFFAVFKEAGVAEDRKVWSTRNGLPESTGDWSAEHFAKAIQLLEAPTHKAIAEACEFLGIDDLEKFCEDRISKQPTTLKEWKLILSHLNALADAEDQRSLV